MGDRPLSLDELQLVARSQAAGLARLTGEIDRLRAERDEALREATMAEAKRSQAVYDHNQLKAENEAFRRAIREDDGPSCDDVCQRSCIGVCGAGVEVDGDVD